VNQNPEKTKPIKCLVGLVGGKVFAIGHVNE